MLAREAGTEILRQPRIETRRLCNYGLTHALGAVGADALTNATSRAAEAAAINCRRSGCNPPWRDELTNL